MTTDSSIVGAGSNVCRPFFYRVMKARFAQRATPAESKSNDQTRPRSTLELHPDSRGIAKARKARERPAKTEQKN